MKVSINGFGRIGRLFLRAALKNKMPFSFSCINDLMPVESAAHLLKYDSVHGSLEGVSHDAHSITVNGYTIPYTQVRDTEKLNWAQHKTDLLVECSGIQKSFEGAAQHIQQGAPKVLVSAPCSGNGKTVVYGVNHHTLQKEDTLISNASCTTNALAPIFLALESLSIQHAYVTTTHAYTADQKLVDSYHSDLRRARAAAESIIPTSTGAAKALALLFPNLTGKVDGIALRVPCANVSLVDLSIVLKTPTTEAYVNELLNPTPESSLHHVMGFCTEPLVSKDFCGSPQSVIIDSLSTKVIGGTLIKVFGWYDNEWGFANRLCDVAKEIL